MFQDSAIKNNKIVCAIFKRHTMRSQNDGSQLRPLAALAENPGSVPNTHTEAQNPLLAPAECGEPVYMESKHSYT